MMEEEREEKKFKRLQKNLQKRNEKSVWIIKQKTDVPWEIEVLHTFKEANTCVDGLGVSKPCLVTLS